MRGAELTERLSTPQTIQGANRVCAVDANQPVLLFIDLEDSL